MLCAVVFKQLCKGLDEMSSLLELVKWSKILRMPCTCPLCTHGEKSIYGHSAMLDGGSKARVHFVTGPLHRKVSGGAFPLRGSEMEAAKEGDETCHIAAKTPHFNRSGKRPQSSYVPTYVLN